MRTMLKRHIGLGTYGTLAILVCTSLPAGSPATEAASPNSTVVMSLDGSWILAPDPKNVGRHERWWEKPVAVRQADQGSLDHPGGYPWLPWRGLVLARFRSPDDPPPARPLPVAVLDG